MSCFRAVALALKPSSVLAMMRSFSRGREILRCTGRSEKQVDVSMRGFVHRILRPAYLLFMRFGRSRNTYNVQSLRMICDTV